MTRGETTLPMLMEGAIINSQAKLVPNIICAYTCYCSSWRGPSLTLRQNWSPTLYVHILVIAVSVFFPLSAFWVDPIFFFFLIFFSPKKKKMDDAQTHFGPDETSVMRLAYCVDYKPNMLHNRNQSVYGHRIARHMFDKEKRAVVEEKKKEKRKKRRQHIYIA
jgi:hypothetical protein